jgi:hypothetical protein
MTTDKSSSKPHQPAPKSDKPAPRPAKSPDPSAPPDPSGLWNAVWDGQTLDGRAVQQSGLAADNGGLVPHGTYTRVSYLTALMTDGGGGAPELLIFDDNGCFCRLGWNGKDAWVSKPGPHEFTVPGGTPFSAKPSSLTRYPTLALDKYDNSNVPSNTIVGTLYVRSVGDPTKQQPVPEQRVKYDPLAKTLTWATATFPKGLELVRAFRQPSEPGQGTNTFKDVFHGQYQFAQVAFPFYGFDPRYMDLYPSGMFELAASQTGGRSLSGAGTPAVHDYGTNLHQTFNGSLIFAFPTENSQDYVRGVDMDNTPFLPIGITGLSVDSTVNQTHTVMLSSVADRMGSWSLTLGLNGGVEGLISAGVKGTYSSKVETQQTTESRYTVSRLVTVNWIALADIPSLRMHEDVVGEIKSRIKKLLSGAKDLQWDEFVTRFGSHYAHAMTEGKIDVAETRFTLDAESTAYTNKVDLKGEAGGVLDAVKVDATADYSKEWAAKNVSSVSDEDVTTFSLGGDYPVAIMFDLRPFTELLSPVFFRYDPDDTWGQYAPWVWSDLRDGLAAYLANLGLGAPIPLQDHVPFDLVEWRGSWGSRSRPVRCVADRQRRCRGPCAGIDARSTARLRRRRAARGARPADRVLIAPGLDQA